MEVPLYQTLHFKLFIFGAALFCLLSIILNYRMIRSRKPANQTFIWSTLLWGFLGYFFPVISTIVLHFLTKDSAVKGA